MKKDILYETTALLFFLIAAASIAVLISTSLRISGAERERRSVESVYGFGAEGIEISVEKDFAENAYGSVDKVYLLNDGNYLVKTTGRGGFQNGTVTLWNALACTGNQSDGTLVFHGIKSVKLETNTRQSYLSRVKNSFYREFTLHDEEILQGKLFSAHRGDGIFNFATGASYSSAAIDNAVNAAIVWLKGQILKTTPTEKYAFESFVNLEKCKVSVAGQKAEYLVETKPNSPARAFTFAIEVENGVIKHYEIKENGSTSDKYIALMPDKIKDGSYFVGKNAADVTALLTEDGALSDADETLRTGASRSALSCVRAAAFALLNYDLVLSEGGIK